MAITINDCACGIPPYVRFSSLSGLCAIGCSMNSMKCASYTQMELGFSKAVQAWNILNPSNSMGLVKDIEETQN